MPRGAAALPGERGAVTAEFAVALPAVIVLLAFLAGAVGTGVVQIRAEEAARAGARATARGESREQVSDEVSRVGGSGAVYEASAGDGIVTITVTIPIPALSALSGQHARASASLSREAGP